MSKTTVAAALAAMLANPVFADKKLDDAIAKADEQFAKGKPDEAEKTLLKAASQAGAEGQLALARLQLRLGKEEEGGATLAAAVAAAGDPGLKSQALAAQANFELVAGSGRAALAAAQQAVQAESNARTLAALARAQARVSDGAALATAEKALTAGPPSADAFVAKGEALLAAHQNSPAEAAFREALKLEPKATAAQIGLVRSLSEQNKHVEAVAEGKKATELDAHSAEAFSALALALLRQDPQKNWSEAIGHAQNGAFENEKSALTQLAVGQLFEATANYTQALEAYSKALTLDPTLSGARLAKAKAQMRKDPKNATGEACRLAAESPNSGEMQLLCANALLLSNDFAKAVPFLEKATQLTPNIAEAQVRFATALFLTNQADRAVAPCKHAAELEPANVETLATCGLIVAKGNDYEAGVAMLKKVVAQVGYKDVAGYMNLGWVYRSMTPAKTDDSVAAYRKVLEIDPKNAQAAQGIALAYLYAERWSEAEAAYLKVAEIDPKLVGDANYGIAQSYYYREDMLKAREWAEKAKAAGRDATALLERITKYEKAVASAEERKKLIAEERKKEKERSVDEPDFPSWVQRLNYGNVAGKRKACEEGPSYGVQAATQMAGILRREPEISVREACVKALGTMGAKGSNAISTLELLIADPPMVNPNATPEQMKIEFREGDLIKAMKETLRKIKGQ